MESWLTKRAADGNVRGTEGFLAHCLQIFDLANQLRSALKSSY